MRILLLGHPDTASVYALDRVIRNIPSCQFNVCLSPVPGVREDAHPAVQELADTDARLLDLFMSGGYELCLPANEIRRATILSRPNSTDGLLAVRATKPDLIISIRYRRILKEACIAIPKHGVINLHSGLLPDYRGVMATFWAMLAGEKTIGSTLHRIVDAGIDTGPVISRQSKLRDPASSYLTNVLNLYRSGTDAIVSAVDDIRSLRKTRLLPSKGRGQYFSEPQYFEVEDFLQAGHRLVDGTEETLVATLISGSY